MPGDETRKITTRLEDVIRGMASEVTQTRITQATLVTKQDSMHEDIKATKIDVRKINGRVNKLESWRDKFLGGGKVVGGLVVVIGIIFGALKIFL